MATGRPRIRGTGARARDVSAATEAAEVCCRAICFAPERLWLYFMRMRRWCVAVACSTFVLSTWTACTVDDGSGFVFSGTAGASGRSDGGAAGSSGKGPGGGSSGAPDSGGRSGAGGASSGAGGSTEEGGMPGQSGGSGGSGGSEPDPMGGTAGEPPMPVGECEASEVEPCGDCGERTCDSVTLLWGECIGDGGQQNCWETAEGEALPGEMPEEPKGACTAGVQTCQGDGTWSVCTGAVAPAEKDDCSVAGDDSDCSGTPNDGCNCTAGMKRACGTNEGNCQQGEQTCTDDVWGACTGAVTPLPNDSCLVTGDDANCNGMVNEGCACVADSTSACNDNVACTDNVCTNGVCSNPVSAGFCRIGSQCYANNAPDPSNPCRYCDASANRTGWTNRANTVSCDDGLWCNGSDTCNAGVCRHQFTGNRCTATGPCALTACDEARDSCFRPNTFQCSSETQTQCASTTTCGADVQTRTVTRNCTGTSATCEGPATNSAWATSTNCGNNQVCTLAGSSYSCADRLGCGSTWCNGGLCWTTTDPGPRNKDAAELFCSNLTAGGTSNWRLPHITDYLTIDRGCNGLTGMPQAGNSTCNYVEGNFFDCEACPSGEGPGTDGCYWLPGMGSCDKTQSAQGGYWSSFVSSEVIPVGYDPVEGHGFLYPTATAEFQFRCVTDNPN